ncbi:MAG: hydrogenase, partial [Muribaculaceae bacterium]|nr:hydrogenase [Muribaculaceae bacterium]
AIVAPSILGQFDAPTDRVYGAFKEIGFHDVVEVAQGAMETVEREGAELLEKIEEGQSFMTTSCCPSYIELVNKHIPAMQPFVSTTRSPMYYTARIVREKYPDSKIVFVGPCVAKRKEARRDENVDYVMTFEEIASVFDGYEIQIPMSEPHTLDFISVKEGHGFGASGGVAGAVKSYLKLDEEKLKEINALEVSNLDKKNIALLSSYAKTGKAPGRFIEVMACEGGCITGPSSATIAKDGKRRFDKELGKQEKTY